jgi:hypothetical protein
MEGYHIQWQNYKGSHSVVIAIWLIVMKNWRANDCKYEIDDSLSLSLRFKE